MYICKYVYLLVFALLYGVYIFFLEKYCNFYHIVTFTTLLGKSVSNK